jgi:hypothetical protein
MSRQLLARIYELISNVRGDRQKLDVFIRWTAGPAIAGVKSASLIRLPRRLDKVWERQGSDLCQSMDISALPLRKTEGGILVLLFKRRMLARKILTGIPGRYLVSLSYPVTSGLDACLSELKNRFSGPGQFPHEVGIFLGYPPEDVIDFSAGKPSPYGHPGYWKVYHRPERARRTFAYMDAARIKLVEEFLSLGYQRDCRLPLSAIPYKPLGNWVI